MEREIRPKPSDDERRAILSALAQDEPRDLPLYRSRWREAALEEGVGADPQSEAGSSALPD